VVSHDGILNTLAVEPHRLPHKTDRPLPEVVPVSTLGQGLENRPRRHSHGQSGCFHGGYSIE